MTSPLAAIVEGHGEVESLPILVRRISTELVCASQLNLQKTNIFRINKSKIVRPGEIEKAVKAASIKLGQKGSIIVLLDADSDDPDTLLGELSTRAKTAAPHINVEVIIAVREYESWIIHSISSLAGKRGLPTEITTPAHPEAIRGAKEWISNLMNNSRYSETIDCPALSAQMDLNLCLNSESFTKLYTILSRIV